MNWKIPIKLKDPVVAEEKREKVFFRRKKPLEQIDNITVIEKERDSVCVFIHTKRAVYISSHVYIDLGIDLSQFLLQTK